MTPGGSTPHWVAACSDAFRPITDPKMWAHALTVNDICEAGWSFPRIACSISKPIEHPPLRLPKLLP